MLDMLTDRCSTMCLLVNLALLYPRATLLFQLSMSLDVASHWLHLHRSAVKLGVLADGWKTLQWEGDWDDFRLPERGLPFSFPLETAAQGLLRI